MTRRRKVKRPHIKTKIGNNEVLFDKLILCFQLFEIPFYVNFDTRWAKNHREMWFLNIFVLS